MSEKKPESDQKKKSILDELKNFQIAALAVQHQERLEDFIRENLQFGDPLIQCLLEKQSEAYEGSHLEMAVHKLASLCIRDNAVKGIRPSAIAAIGNNKIVGVILGTRGKFPQFQGDSDIVVKGQFATAYKNILQKMETQMGESIDDKLDGKNVHINRMILVDQKYRNHGLGTYLLKNSIDDAVREGLDAFYYPVAGPAAAKCANRLKLVTQNALDISEEEPEFKAITEPARIAKGYLAFFTAIKVNEDLPPLE